MQNSELTSVHVSNDSASSSSPSTQPPAPSVVVPSSSPPSSLAERVARAVALLQMAAEALSLDTAPLSGLEVKRSVKFRKGGEQHVPTLASLSARYGLEVPSRPTAAMTASLQQATDVEPVRTAIGELSKAVDDFYFTSRSDSWTTATTLYGVLKKASVREPNLQAAMAAMVEFFGYRHPATKAAAKAKKEAEAEAKALAGAQPKTEASAGPVAGSASG